MVETLNLASKQVREARKASPELNEVAISAASFAHAPHIPEDMPAVPYLEDLVAAVSFWLRRRRCWKSIARLNCLRISMSTC